VRQDLKNSYITLEQANRYYGLDKRSKSGRGKKGESMTTYEVISVVVSIAALVVATIAVFFNGVQTRKATRALLLEQQLARGNAAMHFAGSFLDLFKDSGAKGVSEIVQDSNTAYRFWSLQDTEFFFFQHRMLPTFMYALWMVDLARVYAGTSGEEVYKSHTDHLRVYSSNYPDMIEFFNSIYNLAREHPDENLRNKQVWDYVETWIEDHGKAAEF
jgi:hypothetical protein